jgi:hypothetical protein
VILAEPTNRFRNRLAINILVTPNGGAAIEVLGPGFDVSDLNRGGVQPQYVLTIEPGLGTEHLAIGLSDLTVCGLRDMDHDNRRRAQRLRNIGVYILPAMGVSVSGDPIEFAHRWLLDRGWTELWEPWGYQVDLHKIQRRYDDAFLVRQYLYPGLAKPNFVLGGSRLPGGRFVWWDVADGRTKWGSDRDEGR